MSYTLSNAVTSIKSQVEWLTRSIVLEPLVGLVDGSNKLFRLPYIPASSGTLTLYDENGTALSTGYTVSSYDTGVITFTAAPSDIRYASYTAQAYTDTALSDLCREGFGEMQKRYTRGWYLYTSGAVTYLSTSNVADSEPTVGGVAFSDNEVQKRLYLLCCRYALLMRQYEKSAVEDHLFRESGRVAAMTIDTSKRPEALRLALESLSQTIDAAVEAAMNDADDTSDYGTFVPGPKSDEYLDLYEWWPTSRQGRGLAS